MTVASGFTWFHLIPAIGHDELLSPLGIHDGTWAVVTAWMVCGLLIAGALVARMGLASAASRPGLERWFPDDRLTARNLAEVVVSSLLGLVSDVVGKKEAATFFPLIGGLFLYIFTCNILGVFPGLMPPTENINANVGMSLVVFVVFNAVGLLRDPKGYLGHMWGPVFLIGPLLFSIELIGLFIRPVTLSLRLTGNIFGDHTVFGIMSDLVPIGVPVIFLGLGSFVAFMQAFVFSLLSTIYIGLSLPHHEHAHADDDHASH